MPSDEKELNSVFFDQLTIVERIERQLESAAQKLQK